MKTTLKRFLLILAFYLGAFEILMQLAVSRPESWEEKRTLFLMLLFMIGLVWTVLPAFSGFRARVPGRVGLYLALAILTAAVCNFYAWHLRPNLGLYEEPHWVAKHTAFQKQQRERIERNRW